MPMAQPHGAHVRTVLRLGAATAVLIGDAPAGAGARDRLAAAVLRQATGRGDITIGRRPSGRPRLDPPYCELGVSLSRRDPLLLAGFAAQAAVGVDLELDDGARSLDAAGLARDHFSCDEAAILSDLPSTGTRRDLFLRLWVAKEAALKATGRGVFDGLQQPDLAQHAAALSAGDAILDARIGEHRLALAVTIVACPPAGLAYCALALVGPSDGSV